MDRRAKGNRAENEAVKILKEELWETYRVRGSTNRFNQNNDIFGLFDILAIRRDQYITNVKFVQVKSNSKPVLDPYQEFFDRYQDLSGAVQVEVWVKHDTRWAGKVKKKYLRPAHWDRIEVSKVK